MARQIQVISRKGSLKKFKIKDLCGKKEKKKNSRTPTAYTTTRESKGRTHYRVVWFRLIHTPGKFTSFFISKKNMIIYNFAISYLPDLT